MNRERRNKNRGYQQLRLWRDAMELHSLTCEAVRHWPFERRRIASQAIASADSVHRNTAEGYCRRSVREDPRYLHIALSSLGESVSGYTVYHNAFQLCDEDFETLDKLAYRLENSLISLIKRVEQKQRNGDWMDSLTDQGSGS